MDLYDLEPHEFYIEKRTILEDGNLLYDLIPVTESRICPLCGGSGKKHGKYRPRQVRDLPQSLAQVGIQIHSNRYICKDCGNSWVNEYSSIDSNAHITNRLREYIRNESLKEPFKVIADELAIADTTVKRVFDEYIAELDSERVISAPRVLGIDENHLMKNYRAVFVDVEERVLIDILPKRSKPVIKKFIKSLPNYDQIEVVTMDMWRPYRDAVAEVIPNAIVVIDKFHVIKEVTNTLERMRREINKTIDKDERKYLRTSKFLLLSDREHLNKEQEARRDSLFEHFPVFKRPYHIKEMIRDIYKHDKKADAELWYENIKGLVSDYAGADEFFSVFDTIDNWYDEIFNYFDHKYTNAITESINRQINEIGEKGRGYSFDVLRAKAIYKPKIKKPTRYVFPK